MGFFNIKLNNSMRKEIANIIRPDHNNCFQKSLENPIVAKQFFDQNLPQEVRDIVDTSTLTIDKKTFINPQLRGHSSDILFSSKNNDAYIYILLEHQSKPHPLMPFRLVEYQVNIWARHLKLHPNSKKLPLIYPMVFYNGKRKYNAPRNMCDMFENKELGRKFWHEDHQLINVHEIPDEELKNGSAAGMMEYFMKHIQARDLVNKLEEIAQFFNPVALLAGKDFIGILMHYALTSIDKNDKMKLDKILVENLNKDGEEIMGSYAYSIAQEAWDKAWDKAEVVGMEKARRSTILNMLKQNLDISLISQIMMTPVEVIMNIASNPDEHIAV